MSQFRNWYTFLGRTGLIKSRIVKQQKQQQTNKQTKQKQTNKQTKENQLRVWSYLPKQLNYVLSVCLFFCCFVCVCLFVCFFYFLKVSECFYETNYREIMMNKNQKTYRPLRIHRSLPYFLFQYTKTFANLHNTSRCA